MHQVSLKEAEHKLAELIDAAVRGEQVLIAVDPAHVVQLVPVVQKRSRRQFGSAKGLITVHDDFDAPLSDFDEYRA